jgi:hypothetical protein
MWHSSSPLILRKFYQTKFPELSINSCTDESKLLTINKFLALYQFKNTLILIFSNFLFGKISAHYINIMLINYFDADIKGKSRSCC